MRIITLFSGGEIAGAGYQEAGYDLVAGCEISPDVSGAHKANFPDCELWEGDVAHFPYHRYSNIDLLHFSPPCQWYSGARKPPQGVYVDPSYHALPVIEHLKPPFVVMENVPAFEASSPFRHLQREMLRLGYHFEQKDVLNMGHHGIPQTRRRLIVIWRRNFGALVSYPRVKLGWFDAIEDILTTFEKIPLSATLRRYLDDRDVQMIDQGLPGTYMYYPMGYRWKTAKGGITAIPGDQPGFTVLATKPNQFEVYAKGQLWRVTQRGYCRLQTVPDWYRVPRVKKWAKKAIGNGVPSRLTEIIGRFLLTQK